MAEIHKLRVKSPYKLMRILDIKIENKPNNHGYLYLKCYVDEMINIDPTVKSSTKDQIIIYEESENTSDDSEININEPDERNSKRLFNGLVQNIRTSNENGTYYLEIQALTVSSKLDIEKKSRSFQNVDMTYKELINIILSDYTGYGFTQYIGENKKTGKPLFQHKETDWEFLKRAASELNSELYCDIVNSDLAFNFGIPKDHNYTLDDNTYYSAFKDLKAFEEAGGYNAGFNDTDYFYYEVDIRDIYEIGSIIEYKEKELYVREYEGYRNKEELFYKYTLCMKNGVWQKIIYNNILKGATIEGQVIATQKEQVKLHLNIDKTQDEGKAYWFRYAPPSVNIMYSMPVIGDSARLYFPKESSEEPIVTGCARKNGATYQGMSNPNNRYFHTEHGSEIAMLPGALQIKRGSKSLLSINFEDRRGIIITSPEGINLNSSEEILIKTPNKVNINAQSQILVIKGNTNHGVSIDGEVHIKGDRVITKTTNKEVFAGKIESIETKSQLLGDSGDEDQTYDIDQQDQTRGGWEQDIDGNWYYYYSGGEMATGWTMIDGELYYLDPESGVMVTGDTLIKNTPYSFGDDGRFIVYSSASADLDSYHKDALSETERDANARYIYQYLLNKGWSKNASCALLGNLKRECDLNPGRWEKWHIIDRSNVGYGLVQWSPANKFLHYIGLTDSATSADEVDEMGAKELMDKQLECLLYQLTVKNGNNELYQWMESAATIHFSPYVMTPDEFSSSDEDVRDLSLVWRGSFERSAEDETAEQDREERQDNAKTYYDEFAN